MLKNVPTAASQVGNAKARPTVSQRLEEQDKALITLHGALIDFANRLAPVLDPADGDKGAAGDAPASQLVVEHIHDNTQRVLSLIDRVSVLQARVNL